MAFLVCTSAVLTASALALQPDREIARLSPGVFLFAAPEMRDPNFAESVVVLVQRNESGAAGLIINRPMDISLAKALPDMAGSLAPSLPLYFGGPVAPEAVLALVRSARPSEKAMRVLEDVFSTASLEDMKAAFAGPDPQRHVRVYAGYAGWGARQLEAEVRLGHWVLATGKAESIFSQDPSKLWSEVFSLLKRIEVRRRAGRTPL